MALDTALVKQNIMQVMPNAVHARSFVSELGASPLQRGVDRLIWTEAAFPELVAERGLKGAGDHDEFTVDVVTQKLVATSPRYTTEFERTDLGNPILVNLIESMINNLVPGLDVAVTHGTNPATGLASALLPGSIVAGSQKEIFDPAVDSFEEVMEDVMLSQFSATGAALDPRAYVLARKLKDQYGNRKFPALRKSGTSEYDELNVRVSELVGTPGDPRKVAKGNTYAIVGDWAQVYRGFELGELVEHRAGNPDGGDGDLGRRNEKVMRQELFFAYVVRYPTRFTTLQTA